MKWFRFLVSCSAVGSVAATYFENDVGNLDLDSSMETRQPHQNSDIVPPSFQIQRRGNCLAKSCRSKEHDPGSPRVSGARAVIHGPGTVQTKIADSSFKMSSIPAGQTREVRSSHPAYAYVGATALDHETHGLPHASDPIHPLKVKSRGRRVQALIAVPEGGSGRVKLRGDNGIKEIRVQQGTMGGGVASSERVGGAQAYGEISRGGEAHVWSLAR